MAFQLIQCSHRHCVFTIDEDLRHFFLEDRSLLDCLFHAVRSVVLRMFFGLNMSRNFVPGFICVLHIPSGVLLNGTLISIAWLQKAAFQMTALAHC